MHSKIYRLLLHTPLAEALCIVPTTQLEDYCYLYMHDFVQSVHHVAHDQHTLELEVNSNYMHACITYINND